MEVYKKWHTAVAARLIAVCFPVLLGTPLLHAQSEFDDLLAQASLRAAKCELTKPKNCDTCLLFANRALQIAESEQSSVSPARRISAYAFIGDIYHRLRKFDTAIRYLNQGIHFADSTIGRNCKEVSDCFFFLGLIEEYKQAYGKALQYHQTCLEIRQQITTIDPIDLAKSHQRLGACYGNIKERQREQEHLYFAESICQKHTSENDQTLLSIRLDLAISLASSGNTAAATALIDDLVQIPKLNDEQKSLVWYRWGNFNFHNGNYVQAQRGILKTIEIFEKTKGTNYQWLAYYYPDLGTCYEALGDTLSALRCYNKAIDIARYNYPYPHYSIGATQYLIARLRMREGAYMGALQDAQQALITLCPGFNDLDVFQNPPLDQSTNFDFLRKTLWLKAQLFHKLSRQAETDRDLYLRHARKTYHLCLTLVEQIRENLPTSGSQANLISDVYRIFEEAIQVELKNPEARNEEAAIAAAFDLTERSKAFLLYAAVQENAAMQFANIPDSLRKREYTLKQLVRSLEVQRNEESSKKNGSGKDSLITVITDRLFRARQEYELLIQEFETRYPDYFKLKYSRNLMDVKQVQKTLLHPGQTLLSYFVGDSSIFLFTIKPDSSFVTYLPKDSSLEGLVSQLQFGIYGYYTAPAVDKTDLLRSKSTDAYISAATRLYDLLIAPVKHHLDSTVIIFPDGLLGYIPFEALLTGPVDNKSRYFLYPYFGNSHVVSYCYSATMLAEMQAKIHETTLATIPFLGFAPFYYKDPEQLSNQYGPIDTQGIGLRNGPDSLPFSGEEVYRIAQMMHGEARIREKANLENFYKEAPQARILHLSTHGIADVQQGEYAHLSFASSESGSRESKLLYVKNLYAINLKADLVVLSACETGAGALKRGEGVISLARAFTYAGAKSIVTTLWSVSDVSSKDLMIAFYDQLLHKKPVDEALAQAKRLYIKSNKGKAHPFFWAGFVGIGDMRAIMN